MNTRNIDFGKVALKVLELLVIKIFTLPLTIYRYALIALSNSRNNDSEETVLSADYPLYVWYLSTFNAIIAITYPFGLAGAVLSGIKSGFSMFLTSAVAVYFLPLLLGLFRELLSITLKIILYLKIIAQNTRFSANPKSE